MPYKSVHRVAAGKVLPTTSKLRLVQVEMQLVRLIRRTGVRPPAGQRLVVRPTAARRAQELSNCVAFLGDSWWTRDQRGTIPQGVPHQAPCWVHAPLNAVDAIP